ncbi:MAG: cob(I)yrinic acid a,c-diamide adenosyltransferase [Anaerolineales bacterium]
MSSFYTRSGDDGYTSLLGNERVPKYDPRPEAYGDLDEASAALGLARSLVQTVESKGILEQIQRDLYGVMSEVAALPENAERFRVIGDAHVAWLETKTDELSVQVTLPNEFILPGDTVASAALALARTVTRRAERRVVKLTHEGELQNITIMQYLNRLSSLLFVLEIYENQAAGNSAPTLAKWQAQE